ESELRARGGAVFAPVAVASTADQKGHAAPGTPQLPPVHHQPSIRKLGTVDAVGQSTAHTSRGSRRARYGRPGARPRQEESSRVFGYFAVAIVAEEPAARPVSADFS